MKSIVIIILILLISQLSYSKIKMTPYLQAVHDNSITIMVETDSKLPVKVEYGLTKKLDNVKTTTFYLKTGLINATYVHRIMLDNLKSDTIYYYKAIQGNSISKTAFFRTAVKPGTSFQFAVMGDNRSNPKIFKLISEEMRKHSPYFSMYLGDLCYNSKYKTWEKEFFIDEQLELIANVPFFNAIGNHEGWYPNTKAFQQSPNTEKKNKPFYSFDYGDIHFLVLSTEHNVSKGSEQYKFAKKDLEKTNRKWKIVTFHIPAYCAGGHGENANMIKMTKEIFEPNQVDFIFNGHSHFYQRNSINNITHIVFGGGGAPLYHPKKKDYTVKSARDYHYAIFKVSDSKIIMNVYDIYYKLLDSLSVDKIAKP